MLTEKKTYTLPYGMDKRISEIVSEKEDYDHNSHFVRCAIIRLIRAETGDETWMIRE